MARETFSFFNDIQRTQFDVMGVVATAMCFESDNGLLSVDGPSGVHRIKIMSDGP